MSNEDTYRYKSPTRVSRKDTVTDVNNSQVSQWYMLVKHRVTVLLVCAAFCCLLLIRDQLALDQYYKVPIDSSRKSIHADVSIEDEDDLIQIYMPTSLPTVSERREDETILSSVPVPENVSSERIMIPSTNRSENATTMQYPDNSATQTSVDSGEYTTSKIIILQWNHWTDLERIVASIWGDNLFCSTIDVLIEEYYFNHTTFIPIEVNTAGTTNITYEKILPPNLPIPTIHFGIELSCYDLYRKSTDGTGNYIQAIYMMRLALKYISSAKIRLNITCSDNTIEFQTKYVLPWFTGVWYSPHYFKSNVATDNNAPIEIQGQPRPRQQLDALPQLGPLDYCASFYTIPTAIIYQEMQYDVRRMAIALTCSTRNLFLPQQEQQQRPQYPHRKKVMQFLQNKIYYSARMNTTNTSTIAKESYLYANNQQERLRLRTKIVPLIKEPITFDDAVIHFRCGDLLSTTLSSYGFLTFHGYSRHISSQTTRTIGILTQPLDTIANESDAQKQARTLDSGNEQLLKRCRTLVYAFVDHLQERFPNAIITIRNDASETIALAYARMVMAQQVVGGMSTFSTFPIISSFGDGYYLRPRIVEPSKWIVHPDYPVTKMKPNNLKLFRESNIMIGSQTKDLWDTYGDATVLEWFRTGSVNISRDETQMN
jgi:hypothetical protein